MEPLKAEAPGEHEAAVSSGGEAKAELIGVAVLIDALRREVSGDAEGEASNEIGGEVENKGTGQLLGDRSRLFRLLCQCGGR